MKSSIPAMLLAVAMLGIVGCNSTPATVTPTGNGALLVWTDTAPGAACAAGQTISCKSGFEIKDVTQNVTISVPITSTCANSPVADDFQIRLIGYDNTGKAIQSDWKPAIKVVDPSASLVCSTANTVQLAGPAKS